MSAVTPTPLPANVGITIGELGHYSTSPDLPEDLQYADVGDLTYSDAKTSINLELVTGDYNHAGHAIQGTFADVVRLAREEAAIDVIDMPELSSTAIFKGDSPDSWYMTPLMLLEEGKKPDEVDEELLSQVSIDQINDDHTGPGGIWDAIGGYGRPNPSVDELGIDNTNYNVSVISGDDRLAAIVGIDNLIAFDKDAVATLGE